MRISGYEKLTLLDFPGYLSAVVFTPGCVMRCPFCHNPELIEPKGEDKSLFQHSVEDEFFEFLERRRGKLDGVCITGGEPTIHEDLPGFIRRVKKMGFLVKLDTNGVFPRKVQALMEEGIVDYWAMDIKHSPDKYAIASGRDVGIENIRQSVELIKKHAQDYEFRTTVVPGIHKERDFDSIVEWIAGSKAYYLQAFRGVKIYHSSLKDVVKEADPVDLERIRRKFSHRFGKMAIRS